MNPRTVTLLKAAATEAVANDDFDLAAVLIDTLKTGADFKAVADEGLCVADAWDAFNISRSTLYKWMGELGIKSSHRHGRAWLNASQVEELSSYSQRYQWGVNEEVDPSKIESPATLEIEPVAEIKGPEGDSSVKASMPGSTCEWVQFIEKIMLPDFRGRGKRSFSSNEVTLWITAYLPYASMEKKDRSRVCDALRTLCQYGKLHKHPAYQYRYQYFFYKRDARSLPNGNSLPDAGDAGGPLFGAPEAVEIAPAA